MMIACSIPPHQPGKWQMVGGVVGVNLDGLAVVLDGLAVAKNKFSAFQDIAVRPYHHSKFSKFQSFFHFSMRWPPWPHLGVLLLPHGTVALLLFHFCVAGAARTLLPKPLEGLVGGCLPISPKKEIGKTSSMQKWASDGQWDPNVRSTAYEKILDGVSSFQALIDPNNLSLCKDQPSTETRKRASFRKTTRKTTWV